MTQPSVDQTESDFGVGVLPASEGALYAIIGTSSSGPLNTPTAVAKPKGIAAIFGSGSAVEAAEHAIEKYGLPVVFVRAETIAEGAYLDAVVGADGELGAIDDDDVNGTAVFTDNASDPLVEADVVILFSVGGTQGVAGIVYQISLDNGQTWGPPIALGTADHIDIGATGASLSISASGTILAGDIVRVHLTAPIPSSAGEVVHSGLQNAPSIDATTHPDDDYEIAIRFVAGGTRGTPGVTYQTSRDGGRTYGAVTALGTATSIVVPDSGGVKVDLGSGTIAAGATIAFPTVAPKWNSTTLATAIDALRASIVTWEILHVVGPCDADEAAGVDLKVSGMVTYGKFRAAMCSARLPVGGESDATYLASLAANFGDFTSKWVVVCAGAIQTVSSISGLKYRRPFSFVAAAREAASSEEVNTADVKLGALPVARLTDANGNPLHHDESLNPGLDDAGFYVARSWEGYAGVYVNRPRLPSAAGSDFQLLTHRRVMNIARHTSRMQLILELNSPIIVNPTTGRILERVAREIEARVNAKLAAALLEKPKASAVTWVLSRTDNLLATKTLNAEHRIVPLGYAETIVENVSFTNPALQVTTA